MVWTYLMDVTPLYKEEIYNKYYEKIPDWRKEKARHIARTAGKAQSVGAWVLLEKVKKRLGLGNENVYNLSHSGGYALCTVSDTNDGSIQAGCDIEVLGKLRLNVAKRFFTEQEYGQIIACQDEAMQREFFFRYWVLKESFMKATRLGMKLDTRSFEIAFDDQSAPFLVKKPEEFYKSYFYKEYSPKGVNAKIAVCTTEADIAEELEIIPHSDFQ